MSSHGLHGVFFYKDTNLLDGAPSSKPNHPQTSHLLIPSPLGFKISAYELGGHMNIQIIAHIKVKYELTLIQLQALNQDTSETLESQTKMFLKS